MSRKNRIDRLKTAGRAVKARTTRLVRGARKVVRIWLDALGSSTGRIASTTVMTLCLIVLLYLSLNDRLPGDPLTLPLAYVLVVSITALLIGLRELALSDGYAPERRSTRRSA